MNRESFDDLQKRLTAERPWSQAEKRLIAEVSSGEFIEIGEDVPAQRKDGEADGNSIRAELLRWFTLGGEADRQPHEKGVRLWGAWITGALDFEACALPAPLVLAYCRFDAPLIFRDAQTKMLNFGGSHLLPEAEAEKCLAGDGLKSEGAVMLRSVRTRGAVRLLGAEIGGELECSGGRFYNEKGSALSADRAKVAGAVFLRDDFHASGAVRLLGAVIGGDLDCSGGRFKNANGDALFADGAKVAGDVSLRDDFHASGEVRLSGAEIGGDLACSGGRFDNANRYALSADGAKVAGALFLRQPPKGENGPERMFTGALDLTGAEIGQLCDAPDCWPKKDALRIDQFRYGRIAGTDHKGEAIPTDARRRAEWLHLQPSRHLGKEFKSQPWEHLEKVLRQQGDDLEARRLGELKERTRIKAGKHLFDVTAQSWIGRPLQWLIFTLLINPLVRLTYICYRLFAGYGYFTSRALAFALPLWLFGALLFSAAWESGAMAPPNPLVLVHKSWTDCQTAQPEAPNKCWVRGDKPGAKTYGFNSLLYSFDVFLPVLTIEQEGVWEPVRGAGTRLEESWAARRLPQAARDWLGDGWGTIGDLAYAFRFFHEIMGYVLSGFLLAGAARLVREQK